MSCGQACQSSDVESMDRGETPRESSREGSKRAGGKLKASSRCQAAMVKNLPSAFGYYGHVFVTYFLFGFASKFLPAYRPNLAVNAGLSIAISRLGAIVSRSVS